MNTITRKTLLYKSGVEYADYCINHVEGCSHGCKYPCYAFIMKKRCGVVRNYADWCRPKIVENAMELLKKELPRHKDKIKHVHLCFSTDPFMYNHSEVISLSQEIITYLNDNGIRCTVLTKGLYPESMNGNGKSHSNEYGITLVSLDDTFRQKYEPGSAPVNKRIDSLKHLSKKGFKTWVSIEPYPTPNIIKQEIKSILDNVSFVDKIVFGRMHYNKIISQYPSHKKFYNDLASEVINFCNTNGIVYHIKQKTISAI